MEQTRRKALQFSRIALNQTLPRVNLNLSLNPLITKALLSKTSALFRIPHSGIQVALVYSDCRGERNKLQQKGYKQ